MAGGWGGGGGRLAAAMAAALGRALAIACSITTGADSPEKMLRPLPAYSMDSLSASFSRCKAGSSPVEGRRRACPALRAFGAVEPRSVVAWPPVWATGAGRAAGAGLGVDEPP